jgi:hypothetical protein
MPRACPVEPHVDRYNKTSVRSGIPRLTAKTLMFHQPLVAGSRQRETLRGKPVASKGFVSLSL